MTRARTRTSIRSLIAFLAAAALLLGVPLASPVGASPTSDSGAAAGETASEEKASSEEKVQAELERRISERRQAMLRDAHAALDETRNALQALEEDDTEQALEALARATGKLELLLARDPELALAPVDVDLVTHDLYATPTAIREARDEAEQLLEDGRVQQARALLTGLASELRIRVTNLPLATYPDAIKEVSPLLDEGRTDEARRALRAALNTLVVTEQVIPLPVMRARHLLSEAESLLEEAPGAEDSAAAEPEGARSEAEAAPEPSPRERADALVAAARDQLEMADLLGYGSDDEHERFHRQIAELEERIGADEETHGTFARLQRSLRSFQRSFFE